MENVTFPAPPDRPTEVTADVIKARYQAELDVVIERVKTDLAEETERLKAEIAQNAEKLRAALDETGRAKGVADARDDTAETLRAARLDADRAAEVALVKSLHDAYVDVTKQSFDRSLKRSESVTTTIGAISGTYTTLLGLVYAVGDGKPLEPRAVVPVLFLGAALLLASIYAAFLKRGGIQAQLLPSGIGGTVAEDRLRTFLTWTVAGVLQRAWALRSSLVAFGLGIALMPLPFVDVSNSTATMAGAFAGLIFALWLIGEYVFARRVTSEDPKPPALGARRGEG